MGGKDTRTQTHKDKGKSKPRLYNSTLRAKRKRSNETNRQIEKKFYPPIRIILTFLHATKK